MAKSTRSKVKRSFRAKKRTDSVYSAVEAARLNRLHRKLKALTTTDKDGDVEVEEVSSFGDEDEVVEGGEGKQQMRDDETTREVSGDAGAMDVDSGAAPSTSTSISTHGPRNSGREQWRLSKGLPAKPKSRGMNRQGGIAAKRKAGRSQRRR